MTYYNKAIEVEDAIFKTICVIFADLNEKQNTINLNKSIEVLNTWSRGSDGSPTLSNPLNIKDYYN
jgi:hypothetical protein